MTRPGCRFYAFLPALRLAVCGDAAALQHFDREYGPRALADAPDRSEVSIQFLSEGRRRTDPPVSEPMAMSEVSSATETPAPDDDPPGMRVASTALPGVP